MCFTKTIGSKDPIILDQNNRTYGRFISFQLTIIIKTNPNRAYWKKRIKSKVVNIFIYSVYHLNDEWYYFSFNSYLSTVCNDMQSSFFFTSSQEINTWIGVYSSKRYYIEPNGLNNRTSKGVEALNLLRMYNIFAVIPFYINKNKVARCSFDGNKSNFQLNQWMVNSLTNIKEASIVNFDFFSDYSVLRLRLYFHLELPKDKNT